MLKRSNIKYLAITAILLVSLPLAEMFPGFWIHFFCRPAAAIASWMMGVGCIDVDDGCLLLCGTLPVRVTVACSAAKYFFLLNALIVGLAFESRDRMNRWNMVLLVISTWPVTVYVNAVRIYLGWVAGVWSSEVLPSDFRYSIHTAVGVLVFSVFLVVFMGTIKWRSNYVER